MTTLVSTWESEIRKDLTPFVDPATPLRVAVQGDVIEASWTQRRKNKTAKFIVKGAEGLAVDCGGREMSYRSFLALEDMGDVLGIAQTTASIYGAQLYVDATASFDQDIGQSPALEGLRQAVSTSRPESALTPFIMVSAEAGAGKTSLLKELVRSQAEKYLAGESGFVFLYVNAQGRALARFHEALSTELNELRVAVPYHAIAVLVRHGLVVPVVDGFDELLGAGGYDDAFASIWSFIQELDGRGAMVTSARSTYYEQEFLARSERANSEVRGGWELRSVTLSGWSESQRNEYVRRFAEMNQADEGKIKRELDKVFSGERYDLADKPLFVARAVRVIAEGGTISGEGSLISRLADEFIAREIKEKLRKKDGGAILSHSDMQSLCSDLAEEMWNLGTRELDRMTVSEVAEVAMSDHQLSQEERNIVVSRMPNMAFLQPGESPGAVSFEHELFFDHFLASRAASNIVEKSAGLALMLSRAPMPDALTNGAARMALETSPDFRRLVENVNAAAESRVSNRELIIENCGRLVCEMALVQCKKNGELEVFDVSGLVFPGASLANVSAPRCDFKGIQFKHVDLRGAKLRGEASGSIFESVLIDAATQLELQNVDPGSSFRGIRFYDGVSSRSLYEPREITEVLKDAGLPAALRASEPILYAVDSNAVDIVSSYVKATAKSNPLCVSENPFEFKPNVKLWAAITRLGEQAGIFRTEFRQARGPRMQFVRRLFRGEEIMAGRVKDADVRLEIRRFWEEMERQFPSDE